MTTRLHEIRRFDHLARWWRETRGWARDLTDDERGDVPGWVLVTLMTAGLPVIRVSG